MTSHVDLVGVLFILWGLLTTLATLYAEGKQKEQATQKLQQMEQLLVEHPDAGRAAMLEDLRKHVWSSL